MCHDPYNVPSKFGEDPLRNVETYSRTDRHTRTYTHTDTDTQTHTYIPQFIVRYTGVCEYNTHNFNIYYTCMYTITTRQQNMFYSEKRKTSSLKLS
jgi:hypothetical protein